MYFARAALYVTSRGGICHRFSWLAVGDRRLNLEVAGNAGFSKGGAQVSSGISGHVEGKSFRQELMAR